jgi:hypothetical protein
MAGPTVRSMPSCRGTTGPERDQLPAYVVVAPDVPQPTPAAGREAVIELAVEGAVTRVPRGVDGATLALVLQTLKSLR